MISSGMIRASIVDRNETYEHNPVGIIEIWLKLMDALAEIIQ